MQTLNTDNIHPTWREIIKEALNTIDPVYLETISKSSDWLPGPKNIFNAFSLPLPSTRYILFGESPYPRVGSANGYAFWDGMVHELWSEQGLSKRVNRATSLRHLIKMLLIAENVLPSNDPSQKNITLIDKQLFIKTIDELFGNFLQQGFLLLNASLVLSQEKVREDAKAWRPFIATLLKKLSEIRNSVELVLFGKIAEEINRLPEAHPFPQLVAEHPYNQSFLYNQKVLHFFQPLHLLRYTSRS